MIDKAGPFVMVLLGIGLMAGVYMEIPVPIILFLAIILVIMAGVGMELLDEHIQERNKARVLRILREHDRGEFGQDKGQRIPIIRCGRSYILRR